MTDKPRSQQGNYSSKKPSRPARPDASSHRPDRPSSSARSTQKSRPGSPSLPIDSKPDSRQNGKTGGFAASARIGSGSSSAKGKGEYKKSYAKNQNTAPAKTANRDNAEELRMGDSIVVTIKRLGINGEGVGYYRRKAVFVDGALPNEVVKAQVTGTHPKFIKATITEIEKRSPERVEPPCPVFHICGGCQIQHISYKGQLQAKTDIVIEAFSRYAGLEKVKIKPMLGMEHPWAYRNKAQPQLGRDQDQNVIAGLYEINSHDIVDISGCPIQHPAINNAIEIVKSALEDLQIPLHKDNGSRDGVRTIVVRYGFQSNHLQITLVTTSRQLPRQDELIQALRLSVPDVTSIAINVNPKKTSLVFGEHTVTLWGQDTMLESLGDLEFALSPRAFFQLNPQQTVKLYESVRAAAGLTGKELVVDAYCGTGTIGLWLAPYAREVRGIEMITEAVDDANKNAYHNNRDNASFYVGKAEELLPRWVKKGMSPDVIIADPPRTGLEQPFLETVLKTKPKRFVYVSCNPSTLAKDCKVLLDGGYEIQWVQPIDMFPQTSHVEAVTLLVRKDA